MRQRSSTALRGTRSISPSWPGCCCAQSSSLRWPEAASAARFIALGLERVTKDDVKLTASTSYGCMADDYLRQFGYLRSVRENSMNTSKNFLRELPYLILDAVLDCLSQGC